MKLLSPNTHKQPVFRFSTFQNWPRNQCPFFESRKTITSEGRETGFSKNFFKNFSKNTYCSTFENSPAKGISNKFSKTFPKILGSPDFRKFNKFSKIFQKSRLGLIFHQVDFCRRQKSPKFPLRRKFWKFTQNLPKFDQQSWLRTSAGKFPEILSKNFRKFAEEGQFPIMMIFII